MLQKDILPVPVYVFPIFLICFIESVMIMQDGTTVIKHRNQHSSRPEKKLIVIHHSDIIIITHPPIFFGAGNKNVWNLTQNHMAFIDIGTMRDNQLLGRIGHIVFEIVAAISCNVLPVGKDKGITAAISTSGLFCKNTSCL